MKFCYCDESGTGNEPYAIMAAVFYAAKNTIYKRITRSKPKVHRLYYGTTRVTA